MSKYVIFDNDNTLNTICHDKETKDYIVGKTGYKAFIIPCDYNPMTHNLSLVNNTVTLTQRDIVTEKAVLEQKETLQNFVKAKLLALKELKEFRDLKRREGIMFKGIKVSADDTALNRVNAGIANCVTWDEENAKREWDKKLPQYRIEWIGSVLGQHITLLGPDLKDLCLEIGKYLKLTITVETYFIILIGRATTLSELNSINFKDPQAWVPPPTGLEFDIDLAKFMQNIKEGKLALPTSTRSATVKDYKSKPWWISG